MRCIEMDIDVLIELPELMINRNMRCIEISNTYEAGEQTAGLIET